MYNDTEYKDYYSTIRLFYNYNILSGITVLMIIARFLFFFSILKKIYITTAVITLAA